MFPRSANPEGFAGMACSDEMQFKGRCGSATLLRCSAEGRQLDQRTSLLLISLEQYDHPVRLQRHLRLGRPP